MQVSVSHLQQRIAPQTFKRLFFSSHQHLFVGTAQKRLSRWNTGWNRNGKLTTYRTQRPFGKGTSKGKWAGERLGHPAWNQLLFIKSIGTCTYQHGIQRPLSLTVPCSLTYYFFSSDLRKSSFVFWHRPSITTQKISPRPLYLIQHDGEVLRLATTSAQLWAVWLCLRTVCLNYQTLLRAGGYLGRAPYPMVPLHSTALAQADVQALPELPYGFLKIPPDSVHILTETHIYKQASVAVGKEVFVS